jgi:hypothetical protein
MSKRDTECEEHLVITDADTPVFDTDTLCWLREDANILSCGYANTLHYYGTHEIHVRHLVVDNSPALKLPHHVGESLLAVATGFAQMLKRPHICSIEVHMHGRTVEGLCHVDRDEETSIVNVVIPLNDLYHVSKGGCTALRNRNGQLSHLTASCNRAICFDGKTPHWRTAATSAKFASGRRILIIILTERQFAWKALGTVRRMHRIAMRKNTSQRSHSDNNFAIGSKNNPYRDRHVID